MTHAFWLWCGVEVALVLVISYDMTGVAASYDFLTERRLLRSKLLGES